MGATLCRLFMPNAFGGKARSDLNTSHIVPPGVLAAGSSPRRGWSGTDEGWSQTGARAAPLLRGHHRPIAGRAGLESPEQGNTEGLLLANSVPLKCVPFPLPAAPSAPERSSAEQEGLEWIQPEPGHCVWRCLPLASGLPLTRPGSGGPLPAECC